MAAGRELKVTLVGTVGVGKSCLARRLTTGKFPEHAMAPTIGAGLYKLDLEDAGKVYLWDTAGQERYRVLIPMYYRNAAVIMLCFDLQDIQEEALKHWADELKSQVVEETQLLLVGTKADKVTTDKAESVCKDALKICADAKLSVVDNTVWRTSSATGTGVAELRAQLKALCKLRLKPQPRPKGAGAFVVEQVLRLGMVESEGAPSPGCC
jgi:small GTP-binding protein